MPNKIVMRINPFKLHLVIKKDPRYMVYSRSIAARIEKTAMVIFEIQNHKDNEAATSEFTPPKYIASFRLDWHANTASWRVVNDDPGWFLVEWGAHAGGKTRVLRYRPLSRALDIVAAGGG